MDETAVTSLVEHTQKPLFGFVLSLSSTGREKAFEIAVSSFTDTFRLFSSDPGEPQFLRALFRVAIEKCRNLPPATGTDLREEAGSPGQKNEQDRLIQKAMFPLSFEQKCALLLRDGQHFGYEDMAAMLGSSPKEARVQVLASREALRGSMEKLLG